MKIDWLGHACFLLETDSKCRILTDPFNEGTGYPPIDIAADVVTISHDHWDHNAVQLVKGEPVIINREGAFTHQDIQFEGIGSFHDKVQGKQRGRNVIYKITADGIRLLHLGDLGSLLTREQVDKIGPVDIIFVPVGGNYTIDAGEAFEITKILKPRIVVPMHFKSPVCTFEIAPVEAFTGLFEKTLKKPSLQIERSGEDNSTQIIVLDYPVN